MLPGPGEYRRWRVRQATVDDAVSIGGRIEGWDLWECTDLVGSHFPVDTLAWPFEMGLEHQTWVFHRKDCAPDVIFGVGAQNPDTEFRALWMIAAPMPDADKLGLAVMTRMWTPLLLERWPLLGNAVPAEHTRAQRWLKHVGVAFLQPFEHNSGVVMQPFVVTGEVFAARQGSAALH